jgi:hypothetical protein
MKGLSPILMSPGVQVLLVTGDGSGEGERAQVAEVCRGHCRGVLGRNVDYFAVFGTVYHRA